MKIIHTSDWHIGQTFYNYSREEEHRHFFNQLAEITGKEKPDALIVAGDIFDTALPPISSQRLLVEALSNIHYASPESKIVLTAGNHDSASRLDIHSPLWKNINVFIFSQPALKATGETDFESLIIEIKNKGLIAAVPFIPECSYGRYVSGDSTLEKIQNFHSQLLNHVEQINIDKLPVVLSAHIAVSGADSTGQDRSRLNFIPLSAMGSGFSYLALGHIHHPMSLNTADGAIARYSGSGFALSFDETFTHSVSVVDFNNKFPIIREIDIKPLINIVTFPKDEPVTLDETLEKLKNIPMGHGEYLRINIKAVGHAPGNARHRIEQIINGKNYRFCTINIIRDPKNTEQRNVRPLTAKELAATNPIEIAGEYYFRKYGAELPLHFTEGLKEAIRICQQNQREEIVPK